MEIRMDDAARRLFVRKINSMIDEINDGMKSSSCDAIAFKITAAHRIITDTEWDFPHDHFTFELFRNRLEELKKSIV